MIRECPVNMEMRRHDVPDFVTHHIFAGEQVPTYVQDDVDSEGGIDMARIKALLFNRAGKQDRALGTALGRCCRAGEALEGQRA